MCKLVVASPLVIHLLHRPLVDLSRQLVVALPFAILSLHHPLVLSLRQLVVALPLLVLSLHHPLVLSSRRLVVASPLDTPPSRRLVISSYCPLVISSRQLVVALFFVATRCPTLSSSHHVGWLLRCLFLRCPLVLPLCQPFLPHNFLAVVHCRRHIECCQMLLPPSNATVTAAIERNFYYPPLPQLLSIATVKHQCPPTVATRHRWCQSLSLPRLPFRSPSPLQSNAAAAIECPPHHHLFLCLTCLSVVHCRCGRMLLPQLNAPPTTAIERRLHHPPPSPPPSPSPPSPPPPPPALLISSPSSIDEERGSSTTTTSVPTAAPL